jgi:sugar phosphate isomerase/epimerase
MLTPTIFRTASLFIVLAVSLIGLRAEPTLGLQSWTCRNMEFEEVVQFAQKHGITHVEFFRKHLDPSAPEEETARKLAYLQEHGVTAYSIGVSRTTLNKEDNRQLFEFAKRCGIEVIVVEPGDQLIWDNLEELVREYDIKLAVHNHGTGTTYGNPAVVKHILAERDHRIGVCLDIGWVTAAGFDAETIFRNYGDRVFDMHLKDKRLDLEERPGRPLGTHIGLGNSNYDGIFRAIQEKDWNGVMALETDNNDFAADPTEFVVRGKAFFERYFPPAK